MQSGGSDSKRRGAEGDLSLAESALKKEKHEEKGSRAAGRAKGKEDKDDEMGDKDKMTAAQARRRRRRGGKKSEKKMPKLEQGLKAILIAMMKMTLKNHRDCQDLKAVTIYSAIMPADSVPAKAVTKEATEYGKAVRTNPLGHSLGPPAVCLFLALIEEMAKANVGQLNQEGLSQYSLTLGQDSQANVMAEVRHFRLVKTHKEDKIRLEWSLKNTDLHGLVLSSLTQLGAVQQHGTAPPTALQDECEEWLELMIGN